MKKLKTLMMLGLVLTASVVLVACAGVQKNGKWETLRAGGQVFVFAHSKTYGAYQSENVPVSGNNSYSAIVNKNYLIIARAVDGEGKASYTVNNIRILVPGDVTAIKDGVDPKPAAERITVKYTTTADVPEKAITNVASSVTEPTNIVGLTTAYVYKDRYAKEIAASHFDLGLTLTNVDVTKSLNIKFSYFVAGDATAKTFDFTFELGKAVLK